MDEQDLRNAFIEEAQSIELDAKPGVDLDGLVKSLRIEAAALSTAYRESGDVERRHAVQRMYQRIDKCLGEIAKILALEPGDKRRYEERAIEPLAEQLIENARREANKGLSQQEQIEKGRKHLLEKHRAGAGANTFKRIRAEIDYLIANYTPGNDAKIETLIDRWRTSGDPDYSPEIRIKFLAARNKRDSSNYPI